VAVDGQSVILTDLQGTNGTFLNGRRVEQAELRPNDWIAIGRHILTFIVRRARIHDSLLRAAQFGGESGEG
jgi:pSer/pThr/pTyr-binding forkhead associated (FHA) protein